MIEESQIKIDLNFSESNNQDCDEEPWKKFYSIDSCVENADAIVVITEWEEFKKVSWKNLYKLMRKPSWIFDTRGIIDSYSAENAGFNVWSVGRG